MAREREQIMLAYPYNEGRLQKWFNQTGKVIIQPKYEGDRCRAWIDPHGKVTLLSSSARVIESVPHINQALESLNLAGIEFDGELYQHGMPHEEIRSRVSRTAGRHPNYSDIEYHIYDLVGIQEQRSRLIHLHSLIPSDTRTNPLVVSPAFVAHDHSEVDSYYQHILNKGYEGIILRHPNAPYERKRSTNMMKLKPRLSGIYQVLGWSQEHTIQGEPKQSLGTLVLNEGQFDFEVGTGFTRQQREDLWKERDKLKGRYVKIRYQALSTYGIPKMASFESFVQSDLSET